MRETFPIRPGRKFGAPGSIFLKFCVHAGFRGCNQKRLHLLPSREKILMVFFPAPNGVTSSISDWVIFSQTKPRFLLFQSSRRVKGHPPIILPSSFPQKPLLTFLKFQTWKTACIRCLLSLCFFLFAREKHLPPSALFWFLPFRITNSKTK